ncbi:MAG: hypothetical protein K6T30_03840 [Alicyclobacillus sp.]|nr:hypothetical protein [Alicyclobacillus sp.]
MRHLERLQTGMALAGLVLCLTTTGLSSAESRADKTRPQPARAAARPAAGLPLAAALHVRLEDAEEVRITSVDSRPVRSAVRVPGTRPDFRVWALGLDSAPSVAGGGRYRYRMEFLAQGGAVRRELWMTAEGTVLDARTGMYFRAGRAAAEQAAEWMRAR